MEDRLLREEGEPADRLGLVLGQVQGADRRLGLQRRREPQEDRLLLDVGVRPLLLDRGLEPLEPSLDHLEVGQDQLRLQVHDVRAGRRGRARRVGEGTHHVEQGVRVPELLGVEPLTLPLGDAGEVHHLECRVGGLLRLEERGEPVHALIGHASHAHVQLPARGAEHGRRHTLPREEIEQRRLAAPGQPHQSDLHEGPMLPWLPSWP